METSSRATSLRSAAVKKVAEQQNDKLILTSRHVTSDCPAEEFSGGYKFITRTDYSTNSVSSFNNTFAIVVYNIAAAKFNFALERRRIGTTGSVLLDRRGTQRAQLVQRTAFTWPLLCLQRPPLRRFFVFNERNMEKIRHHTKTR
ncbi:hypothetical protein GQX74_010959 [Glossina fuscipes]|nr:hypothetical protein GQX74_010959 [Glossina fuscipes]